MQNNEIIDKNVIFNKPNKIIINNYEFTYKDELINQYFSYRCKRRKECGLLIKVCKTKLNQIYLIKIIYYLQKHLV